MRGRRAITRVCARQGADRYERRPRTRFGPVGMERGRAGTGRRHQIALGHRAHCCFCCASCERGARTHVNENGGACLIHWGAVHSLRPQRVYSPPVYKAGASVFVHVCPSASFTRGAAKATVRSVPQRDLVPPACSCAAPFHSHWPKTRPRPPLIPIGALPRADPCYGPATAHPPTVEEEGAFCS